ncbi:serine carboxypeptidase II-3-like isoform X2 [Zingiber officinale]|uniref:serine carboxypeptidase II-3-like isoform X2 n=1 Tax=Zingiber officinale TaxID=94328 RepID=UPI001C4DBB80|nr:serine carboxypeptidase II-3-like isoform X2 [Zingiber officinale]
MQAMSRSTEQPVGLSFTTLLRLTRIACPSLLYFGSTEGLGVRRWATGRWRSSGHFESCPTERLCTEILMLGTQWRTFCSWRAPQASASPTPMPRRTTPRAATSGRRSTRWPSSSTGSSGSRSTRGGSSSSPARATQATTSPSLPSPSSITTIPTSTSKASRKGLFDYFWTHALIADETIHAIHKFCNFSPEAFQQPLECQRAVGEVSGVLDDLDLYNIYAPLCFSSGVTPTPKPPSIENFNPCTPNYVEAYLNSPEVQKALHANVTKLNYTWSACSEVIPNWSDSPFTMLPIIKELLSNKLRILKYSGDVDGNVPVTSTRYSLNELGLAVKSPWRAWMLNNEVGGYTLVYEHNLTFATVRGAGHEVPSYQPARALLMIKSFLQGVPLPAS